ncbi:hypothetical protein [Polynucleobacter paneuropaeus]|uniref:hypothetical protein n=1 Tax=Polynucleobacter paneuropaeus TaxID=2527775 RepID=UPI000DBF049D|nr:hypothetical protein [Polynucleobacter paneuropaeus]AWW44056.1 hypothetical protein DPM16_01715 [Polynucleobacter paneuropaeus]
MTSTRLVLGDHLINLNVLLNQDIQTFKLLPPSDHSDVPACYDVKKNGLFESIRSLFYLSKEIHCLPNALNSIFLIDRLSFRERVIFTGLNSKGISHNSRNIYLGYEEIFDSFFTKKNIHSRFTLPRNKIGIFPASRVFEKELPKTLIQKILSQLSSDRFDCTVNIFDDVKGKIGSGLPTRYMKKNFSTLLDTMKDYDYIISSDSLTSHLAEFLNKPVFVFTPRPNSYWLPLSSFANNYWSEFTFDSSSFQDFLGMDK